MIPVIIIYQSWSYTYPKILWTLDLYMYYFISYIYSKQYNPFVSQICCILSLYLFLFYFLHVIFDEQKFLFKCIHIHENFPLWLIFMFCLRSHSLSWDHEDILLYCFFIVLSFFKMIVFLNFIFVYVWGWN